MNSLTVVVKHLKVFVFWLNMFVLVTYTHTGEDPASAYFEMTIGRYTLPEQFCTFLFL
jgi:hypothetical protein